MPRTEVIAGLDIGTSKVCLSVARRQFPELTLEHLGVYSVPCQILSAGGNVTDLSRAADVIAQTLEKAQDHTKQRISTAFVNLCGMHITSENVRGRVNLLSKENEISKKDLDAAYYNAKVSAITYDRQPVLVVPQDYIIDGQSGIKNPLGLFGMRLEVDYLFISGLTPVITNVTKAVNMAGLEIDGFALSNFASSFLALSDSEKDLGVILVDIGAGLAEATIFTEGIVRYDRMISAGSQGLEDAITSEFKTSHEAARKIIKNYCRLIFTSARGTDEDIFIKELEQPRTIKQSQLQAIAEPRIKDTLDKIKEAITASAHYQSASAGVVLIGGISAMDGLAELAENTFNIPVRVHPGNGSITAKGLINYGCQATRPAGIGRPSYEGRQPSENIFKRTFQIAKDFVYDYF